MAVSHNGRQSLWLSIIMAGNHTVAVNCTVAVIHTIAVNHHLFGGHNNLPHNPVCSLSDWLSIMVAVNHIMSISDFLIIQ